MPAAPSSPTSRSCPVPAYGVRMLSIGQLIEPGTAVAWRGPMTASALTSLMEGDWGDCELLIVDLPPGTGDVQMTLIQKWKPAGAVIVSTPQDLSLMDATRAIDMFRKMDVAVIGLIENMAGYRCPHCGEESDPFGSGGAEAAAAVMSIPFLGRIPLAHRDPPGLRRRHPAGRGRGRGSGDFPGAGGEAAGATGRRSRIAAVGPIAYCLEMVDKASRESTKTSGGAALRLTRHRMDCGAGNILAPWS